MGLDRIQELSHIDPWFLYHIQQIQDLERGMREMAATGTGPEQWAPEFVKRVKEYGFSDLLLAAICDTEEQKIKEIENYYHTQIDPLPENFQSFI